MTTAPAAHSEILFETVDDHVALVTLNRPQKRNAVNAAMTAALGRIVKQIEADETIRVAILTSSSGGSFCAGADLAEIAAGNRAKLRTPDGGFAGFTDARRDKPWIAAIRGSALGGGCELALACDMIIASSSSSFGLPEVKRGLFAGAGGVHRLPRLLPRNVAYELIATGDPISAQRAYSLGLLNRIVSEEDVLSSARKLACDIAANAPLAVSASLRVARLSYDRPDADLRIISDQIGGKVMASEDAQEGARAFAEKRSPQWTGR